MAKQRELAAAGVLAGARIDLDVAVGNVLAAESAYAAGALAWESPKFAD
jgi:hypothetical protein